MSYLHMKCFSSLLRFCLSRAEQSDLLLELLELLLLEAWLGSITSVKYSTCATSCLNLSLALILG